MMSNENSTGNWFVDRLNLYQSANSDSQSLKDNFVIRQNEFQLIIEDLRDKGPKDPLQHELLLGRRGSGKSTLLKRIQIEVEENSVLAEKYIAINLAEEQASIYRLFDLWEEVLRELSVKWNLNSTLQSYDTFDDNQSYTRYLYSEIHQLIQEKQKRVVLLLDNFDRILENLADDGHLLREIILNYNDLVIICGSTRMDEHFWRYDQPFYEFFRRHRLGALSSEEIHLLLNHWSEQQGIPQLREFSKKNPGKIEAIRILTDGLPRTLQFFIQILLKDSTLYGFDYLRKVMDNITPLYQERLNHLPAAHRKIVQEMAFIWEACSVKQLVEKCKMESKLLSAHLKQLSNNGLIETISTNKKNNLYRLSERFFNMWLMITQGNPEQKRRARWLTLFLEIWYDENQWEGLVKEHIRKLKHSELSYDRAAVLTKAIAQSKYITTNERDQIIDLTRGLENSEMKSDVLGLPEKTDQIVNKIFDLIQDNEYNEALSVLNSLENEKDGLRDNIQAYLYKCKGETIKAEHCYLQSINKGNVGALFNLANLYREKGNLGKAEEYYLKSVKIGEKDSFFNLAHLYGELGKRVMSEHYYLKAVKNNDIDALNNLGYLYAEQNMVHKAEHYYLQAIEKGNINALNNLGYLYAKQGKIEKAKQYYLKAIENEDSEAMFNLAHLYQEQGAIEKAKQYYLLAIGNGNTNALNNLGYLYAEGGMMSEAEQYYSEAIEKGNNAGLNNLANLYKERGELEKAKKYYLRAVENGIVAALYNLGNLYREINNIKEAEHYYLLAIEKGNNDALNSIANLYVKQGDSLKAEQHYLKAIEEGNINALNNLGFLYAEQGEIEKAEQYYLKAIEKGDVDCAFYNLANLYGEQGEIQKAEKYYYLAIENGDSEAFFNLIVMYLDHNYKKKISYDMIKDIKLRDNNSISLEIVIELWNNIFEKLEEKIDKIDINADQGESMKIIIVYSLYFEQEQFVLSLFENNDRGNLLQEKYKLLYYATLLLTNQVESNLELRIPPEVQPTVNEMVEEIKEKQRFYRQPSIG